MSGLELSESVSRAINLLAVIEKPGQIPPGLGDFYRANQLARHAPLHIDASSTNQPGPINLGRQVVRHRNRVEVTRDDYPLRSTQGSSRRDGVSQSKHFQVLSLEQRGLDAVGEKGLVAGDRLDITDLPGDLNHSKGSVEGVSGRGRHEP